ncbi:hypothetical protein [Ruegeria arenilitoris]|uniref:hypothetical protein n=1 Tax=Ruegeria arenilitoris TaxID=1173585 RepID=UPI00147B8F23|nr:hypothetical protein [Ruegeria arenilitoris]
MTRRTNYTRANSRRNGCSGKIYSIAGGRPNDPLVCVASDARWYSADSDEWTMTAQAIYPTRAWFAADGFDALKDWIASDTAATISGRNSKLMPPTVICVDQSQSPHAVDIMRDMESDFAQVVPVRIGAGEDNPLYRSEQARSGAKKIGASWLPSWFNDKIARTKPDEKMFGYPFAADQIVMDFTNYVDEAAPGLTMAEMREAMASAETLIKKASTASGEEVLDLSAPETVACAVMLGPLAMELMSPTTTFDIRSPWGWGDRDYSGLRMALGS